MLTTHIPLVSTVFSSLSLVGSSGFLLDSTRIVVHRTLPFQEGMYSPVRDTL